MHVDESGQYHVEASDGGIDETTIIETVEAAERDENVETQTIVMHESADGTVTETTIQDDQALEQIQEVYLQYYLSPCITYWYLERLFLVIQFHNCTFPQQ